MQEILLATMPQWHFWFARPFKRLLDEGISLEMYYCLQILKQSPDTVTMSELSALARIPKQQTTKLVDRLIEHNFAKRVSDPNDRRLIRLKITDEALAYIDRFLDKDAAYFKDFFDALTKDDKDSFGDALLTMHHIFKKMPKDIALKEEYPCRKHHRERSFMHKDLPCDTALATNHAANQPK